MAIDRSFKQTIGKISGSAMTKLLIISILALALLIPTAMVTDLIHEREVRKESEYPCGKY